MLLIYILYTFNFLNGGKNSMEKMFDLSGRVAVITGASSGIGVGIAQGLALHGADIAILARRKELLEDVAKDLLKEGYNVKAYACDVANEEQVKNTMESVIKDFGGLHILVNNAGISRPGSVEILSTEHLNEIIDVNLKALFFTCKYAVPQMQKQKFGRIINTSSVLGIEGIKHDPRHGYSATKGGVVNFTRALAASLGVDGITANAVGPGLFLTEMTENKILKTSPGFLEGYNNVCPLGRAARLEEIRAAYVFFASNEAGYVTGQILGVDGGVTVC